MSGTAQRLLFPDSNTDAWEQSVAPPEPEFAAARALEARDDIETLLAQFLNGKRFTHAAIAHAKSLQGNNTQDRISEFYGEYRKFAAYKLEQIRNRSLRAGGFVLAITDSQTQAVSLVEVDYCEYDVHDGGRFLGMPGPVPFELDDIVDIRVWDAPYKSQTLPMDLNTTPSISD